MKAGFSSLLLAVSMAEHDTLCRFQNIHNVYIKKHATATCAKLDKRLAQKLCVENTLLSVPLIFIKKLLHNTLPCCIIKMTTRIYRANYGQRCRT
jgi:hypothetical protein